MFLCLLKVYLFLWTVSECSGTSQVETRFESVNPIAGEEETLVLFKLRLAGKERLLNGTVIFLVDMDDTYDAAIYISSFKNGEWVRANFGGRTRPCDAFVNVVRKYFILPDAECSLPLTIEECQLASQPWEFYFKNVHLISDNWPTFQSRGLVKLSVHFMSKGKSIGGIEFVSSVIDKQN